MAKKRKTRSQKVRSKARRSGVSSRTSLRKLQPEPTKVEVAPKTVSSNAQVNSADLQRSLKIVSLLVIGQLLIWALLHVTHIDNKLYDLIKI
jgi:hypothetical protein